ncbi:substrate-binding domain-containing protein [Rubritalea tangerina]|uniref:Substrate-binding domain-containing protein n=2 Tax=Rubritalea tangerina TaxID=430798 RepID=A0ABW4Z946_9BACT
MTPKLKKVGVRLPDWTSGYASRLFEGFLDYCRTQSPFEFHFDHPSGGDIEPSPIDAQWRGDGLLVYRHTKEEAQAWKKAGIPVVNLSAEIPTPTPDFPRVTIDNHALAILAHEHLAALGLRHFAYVHESTRLYSSIRLASFKEQVLKHHGHFHQIDIPASAFPHATRPQQIEKLLRPAIEDLPRPCGILVKDDIAGVWTARLLKSLGIACPQEMPLLGISDDILFCHTTQPPLSSIPYPGRLIGHAAAKLLDSLMQRETIPPETWLTLPPAPIIPRESTHHVTLPDQLVSDALAYIRKASHSRPVHVSELAKHLGVSRESLRQRFITALGHSPKKEIESIRCRLVTEKLRTTDATLDALASEFGFTAADEVCRFVKRLTGQTTSQIRKLAAQSD